MCWCSNYPASAEMQQTCSLPFRSCRILASIWCVEDGIDSSKDAGKLMISILSAVAEIERENIRVQTMEGRIQKAREGRWNGGFAPYGYQLVDGKLVINEEEAEAIRVIYDQYVHTDIGVNGIAKYMENHGICKIPPAEWEEPPV